MNAYRSHKLPAVYLFMTVGILLASGVASSQPRLSTHELWTGAILINGRNTHWVPERITVSEEVSNADGETIERSVAQYEIGENGPDCAFTLRHATLNGRDITETVEAEERFGYFDADQFESGNPFAQELQHDVTFRNFNETEYVTGRRCAVFGYHRTTDGVRWIGTVWIDAATGVPVQVSFASDGPIVEDDVRASNIVGTIHYNADPERWYPLRIVYSMEIRSRPFPFYTFNGSLTSEVELERYFSTRDR